MTETSRMGVSVDAEECCIPILNKISPKILYFLLSLSDNDFIIQSGFVNFSKIPYEDDSGLNLNNQALVFEIQLPKGSKPFS
jgi:hypothetical protein